MPCIFARPQHNSIDRRGPSVGAVEIDLSDNGSPSGLGRLTENRWHVLQTRSRQEKSLARSLTAAGIEHYLPLLKRPRYRGRRKHFVEEPLLASYLFLYGPLEATYFAVATKRVANVINVSDQDRFIGEMRQLRLALDNGADLSPYRYLSVGRTVRVTAGPFRGIEGLIESWAKADRLVLQIEALGRAMSLEIDAGLLDPVD